MILSKTMAESGFDVLTAGNGREALEVMEREGPDIEVVLVDWNMPVMSGLEFVQSLRARSSFAAVRILMVTTETEIEQMERALEAGADEYIMKPFTRDMVEDKLRMIGALV
jgi:two-component system chemotaxis response regulator CheY